MAMDQDSGSEDTDHEDDVEYDSDDGGAPMIGLGGARRGGRDRQVGVGDDDDGEDNMENGGDNDAAGTMELPGAQAVGVTARRGTSMRHVIDDDESEDEEEEAGGEVREAQRVGGGTLFELPEDVIEDNVGVEGESTRKDKQKKNKKKKKKNKNPLESSPEAPRPKRVRLVCGNAGKND